MRQKGSGSAPPRHALRVLVHVRGEVTDDNVREDVERRVRFAFARFGSVLRRARVELARHRDEVTCRVQLHGVGERHIAVLAVGGDRMLAVGDAIEQATRELARRLRRGREIVPRVMSP